MPLSHKKVVFDANLLLLACLRLQKDLQTVDAGDADITHTADLVRREELHGACALIVIIVQRYAVIVADKFSSVLAGGTPDDEIDRVGPLHHRLCCGKMDCVHALSIFSLNNSDRGTEWFWIRSSMSARKVWNTCGSVVTIADSIRLPRVRFCEVMIETVSPLTERIRMTLE